MTADPVVPFLDTVILLTQEHEALAAFYQQGLQLPEPQAFGDDHVGIQLEGLYLGFDRVEEPTSSLGSGVSLWFGVNDLEATYARLLDLGGRERYPPTLKPFGDRLASVYDPVGNVMGIVERG